MSVRVEGRGEELLRAKNFCTVSTLRGGRERARVPVWVDVQEGLPVLNTAEGRAWLRQPRARPARDADGPERGEPVRVPGGPRTCGREDARGRRRPHRRAGQEVHGRGRVPAAPARGTARDHPRRARGRARSTAAERSASRPSWAASAQGNRNSRRHSDRPLGRSCSQSSRRRSSPRPRAARTHSLWAWRRRRVSPSGAISICSLRAGSR